MLKVIRSNSIQSIPPTHIPYLNVCGSWVWRKPEIPPSPRWPGQKPPTWATGVVYNDGKWCWTDGVEDGRIG